MPHHLRFTVLLPLAILAFASMIFAQNSQRPAGGGPVNKSGTSAPAPRHDLSGTWAPANGPGAGIQAGGVVAMPNDGKPEHQLPYTPYGEKVYKSRHPLEGADAALPGFHDDPRDTCEPMGFPRANFYNLRETQIMQDEYKIAILYQYATTWRIIWTDGRPLPEPIEGGVKIGDQLLESRFYGYSVGKWVDDTTLVVETVGMMGEDKVWLDTSGRPISDKLKVTETFHRVNHDRIEWSVTIDDPKMYTKPWVAMNKFPMVLEDPHRDIMEQYCSYSESQNYDKLFADPSSGKK